MKRLSLQWRITIMTALLTCAACVLMNCLVGYTGMLYMDAIGSDISALNAAGVDSPQAFDPTNSRPRRRGHDRRKRRTGIFWRDSLVHHGWSHAAWRRAGILCERPRAASRCGILPPR